MLENAMSHPVVSAQLPINNAAPTIMPDVGGLIVNTEAHRQKKTKIAFARLRTESIGTSVSYREGRQGHHRDQRYMSDASYRATSG